MESSFHWVRDTRELASILAGVGQGPLCVDSEADSMHHYPEKVCLVQLSCAGRDYLVDPLADVDLSVLAPVLTDESVTKVLHGADYDLRVLHRDFGFELHGLFDTMLAARLTGERSVGLAALLDRHFGVRLDKRFQRADWSRRPLPEAMQRYAALDTHHLEPLAAKLRERLAVLGRTAWADEEFRRLEQVRWNPPQDGHGYRRLKGAASLDRAALAVLRELAVFRESEARRADRPPFKILQNELLVEIARAAPRTSDQLSRIQRVPARWSQGSGARKLLDVVGTAREMPASEWPELPTRRGRPRLPSLQKRLRRLCRERDAMAAELGIEPSVLAPKATLEQILAAVDRGGSPVDVSDLREWQERVLRPVLERLAG